MNLTDNPLPLFAAIMAGIMAQQVLAWLKKRDKKTAYIIARPLVLLCWLGLGLVMIIGATGQMIEENMLTGTSGFALGLGLMLSGLGQTFDRKRLKAIGIVVLAVGPVIAGLGFIIVGNTLSGMIALALGVGILASALPGWLSGIGQVLVGAIVLGSSVMMLISAFVDSATQPDYTTAAIAVAMFILGLAAITDGVMTVISHIRRASRAYPSAG